MTETRTAGPHRLLILGASARAAAGSAVRAGFQPVCADMFGDEDLREIADVHTVPDYPRGLIAVAESLPPCDWIYTGALENSRQLVGRISRRHRLLGNPPEVLKSVRDPFRVAGILRRAGLPYLDVRRTNDAPEPDGRWLLKPRRSAGGRAIRVWDHSPRGQWSVVRGQRSGKESAIRNPQSAIEITHHSPTYFQEYVHGTPIAALLLASRLNCRLLGITRQFVGEAELHAPPFAYCGSLGPLRMPEALTGQIERIGRVLATECDLRGLFGVDFILREDTVFLTEVNPRYTASTEILELATGQGVLGWHRRACESFADPEQAAAVESELAAGIDEKKPEVSPPVLGKGVIYAEQDSAAVVVPSLRSVLPAVEIRTIAISPVADIPRSGSRVHPGEPICTVFAAAETVAECLNDLFGRVRMLQDVLRAGRSRE